MHSRFFKGLVMNRRTWHPWRGLWGEEVRVWWGWGVDGSTPLCRGSRGNWSQQLVDRFFGLLVFAARALFAVLALVVVLASGYLFNVILKYQWCPYQLNIRNNQIGIFIIPKCWNLRLSKSNYSSKFAYCTKVMFMLLYLCNAIYLRAIQNSF